MSNEKITERLQSADWCIFCKTEHEVALVLNACLDVGIRWVSGRKPTEYIPALPFLPEVEPLLIYRVSNHPVRCIACSEGDTYKDKIDITDWFFNEINK